jgi:hypothetical protein
MSVSRSTWTSTPKTSFFARFRLKVVAGAYISPTSASRALSSHRIIAKLSAQLRSHLVTAHQKFTNMNCEVALLISFPSAASSWRLSQSAMERICRSSPFFEETTATTSPSTQTSRELRNGQTVLGHHFQLSEHSEPGNITLELLPSSASSL